MKIFSFFKNKKVKEEIKEEKKSEIKQEVEKDIMKVGILHYDTVKNIIHLDGIEYKFDIESEDRLQELHRKEKLTLYKNENGLDTFQVNIANTFLKLDRQLLIYFLLVSQEKFKKHEYEEFKKYMYELMNKHKLENSLLVFTYEMYLRYLENGNFQNLIERGLNLMLEVQNQRILNITQTSPKCIKDIVDCELEKIFMSSQK